ncbi:hypothetical protein [Raoultella sp. T31]|uniref:hypothetical protein n=1 Tax=Raoultella sp. T31 TaxID=2054594 RepID=UPI001D0CEAE5
MSRSHSLSCRRFAIAVKPVPASSSALCHKVLMSVLSTVHREHMMSVWSTPSVPENHARQIVRMVDRCR